MLQTSGLQLNGRIMSKPTCEVLQAKTLSALSLKINEFLRRPGIVVIDKIFHHDYSEENPFQILFVYITQ